MIKLWLSGKLRFLACAGWFLAGLLSLITPWYVFAVVLVIAFVCDYSSFKFMMDSME